MLIPTTLSLVLIGASQSPSDRLVEVLDAIHGIGPATGPSVEQEAQDICADPATYLPLLASWLDPQLVASSQDPLTGHRVANALALAVRYCGVKGRDLAQSRLKDIRGLRDAKLASMWSIAEKAIKDQKLIPAARELRRVVDALIMAERFGLASFAGVKDKALVPDLLPRITTEDVLSLEMVEYFIQAAPGDARIQNELSKLKKATRWETLRQRIDAYLKL